MRIGISGKGGVGKTSISAVLSGPSPEPGTTSSPSTATPIPTWRPTAGCRRNRWPGCAPCSTSRVARGSADARARRAAGRLRAERARRRHLRAGGQDRETRRWLNALTRDLGIPRVAPVGNLGRDGDGETFEAFARQHQVELVALIPQDEAIVRADRVGGCVLDREPQAPAVRGIEALAEVIAGSPTTTNLRPRH